MLLNSNCYTRVFCCHVWGGKEGSQRFRCLLVWFVLCTRASPGSNCSVIESVKRALWTIKTGKAGLLYLKNNLSLIFLTRLLLLLPVLLFRARHTVALLGYRSLIQVFQNSVTACSEGAGIAWSVCYRFFLFQVVFCIYVVALSECPGNCSGSMQA